MTILKVPENNLIIEIFSEIKEFLNRKMVFCDKWVTNIDFSNNASQDLILNAYDKSLKPFMEKGGYTTSDVISVHSETPGINDICNKFNREHTHTDDEVRFIVDGHGIFWFNPGNDEPVFSLKCDAGVIISVPANTKHWFDMGEKPFVKAIRIFKDEQGWLAHYTNSGIENNYISK